MSSYVSKSGERHMNARLKRLEEEGKTTNETLFEVTNLLTDLTTHVPGGAISRFLNQDYEVREVGPNERGSLAPETGLEDATAEAESIISDAEKKAAEMLADADAKLKAAEAKVKEAEKLAKAAEKAAAKTPAPTEQK